MNALSISQSNASTLGLEVDSFGPAIHPANDAPALPRRADSFASCYRALTPRLRAACAQYVAGHDVDDLVQDVWIVASRNAAKLSASDTRTLSWLIGIAKRCAPNYRSTRNRLVSLDEHLLREAGDDAEGRSLHDPTKRLRARERAGKTEA